MRRLLFVSAICLMASSCLNHPDPSIELVESIVVELIGDNQKATAGENFKERIGVKLINRQGAPIVGYRVEFIPKIGSGTVAEQTVFTDSQGYAYATWSCDTSNTKQTLSVDIYCTGDLSIKRTLNAYILKPGRWDMLDEGVDSRFIASAVSKSKSFSVIFADGSFYRQAENWFTWEKVQSLDELHAVQCDTSGTIYACNYRGNLFKSFDGANTWTNFPITIAGLDPYYIFRISRNNTLWISGFISTLYKSTDGGTSWINCSAGLPDSTYIMDVCYHPSGAYFANDNRGKLYKSIDGGLSWVVLDNLKNVNGIYVTSGGELLACWHNADYLLYMSDDIGTTFRRIYNEYNVGCHFLSYYFLEQNGKVYALVPEKGILETSDFTNFRYVGRGNFSSFFIDHEGTFVARDFNRTNVFYAKGII